MLTSQCLCGPWEQMSFAGLTWAALESGEGVEGDTVFWGGVGQAVMGLWVDGKCEAGPGLVTSSSDSSPIPRKHITVPQLL